MTDLFDNIRLKEAKAICDFVESSGGNTDYIDQKSTLYSRNAIEHIGFLLDIGMLGKRAGRYYLIDNDIEKSLEPANIKRGIFHLIVQSPGPYGKAVRSFIQKFRRSNQGITYRPSNVERAMHSGIRNFMMELDVLDTREDTGEYVLHEAFAMDAYVKLSEYDLESFELGLDRRREIGLAAERLIIGYEVDRLARYSAGRKLDVVHVSQADVSAGYDIRSWTYLIDRDEYVARYIEVKATASVDQRFFWTRNEISKAQELREHYYLYLVPVTSGSSLDVEGLKIIRDPFIEILQKQEWMSEAEVLRVRKQERS